MGETEQVRGTKSHKDHDPEPQFAVRARTMSTNLRFRYRSGTDASGRRRDRGRHRAEEQVDRNLRDHRLPPQPTEIELPFAAQTADLPDQLPRPRPAARKNAADSPPDSTRVR